MRKVNVETILQTPTWNRLRERWIVYAQAADSQWPDIGFDALLATGGSRAALCHLVAQTYGLDPSSAEHAVSVWQHGLAGQDEASPGFTAA